MSTRGIPTQTEQIKKEIGALRNFLIRLASAEPNAPLKFKRGHPRNYIAYLVILDTAALFEWLTETEAIRQVDRESGKEIGPFWKFAGAIWPLVFRRGNSGLSAAIKNWAYARKRFDEEPALIANIALRHPPWGLFDD
jgi:hypothetical protein